MARAASKKAKPASAQMAMRMDGPARVAAPTRAEPAAPPPAPSVVQRQVPAQAPAPAPCPGTLGDIDPRYAPQPPAFGAWLLRQKDRGGFVGELAKAAAADRGFPKAGDPEAVLNHLAKAGADGDMFEALEDAERAWLAS